MDNLELFTGYVKYEDKLDYLGKIRPILLLRDNGKNINYYKITTKFIDKSPNIKQFLYPIQEWKKAGLNKKSWIDVYHIRTMPKAAISSNTPIGKLQKVDIKGMLKQINTLRLMGKYQ